MKQTLSKNIAIMSGYVRYRPMNKTYYLMINSRILANYIKSSKEKIRAKASRENNLFFINFDKKGNIIRASKKDIVLTIPGNKLLNEKEISYLKNKNTKFMINFKVGINPQQLNLDKFYFYPDKDAANLAKTLEQLNFSIPNRVMTSNSFKSDLEFNYENKEVIIEITRRPVSKIYQANFKHQQVGGNIRAHIFDIYRRCVKDKLTNQNKIVGFVILQEEWKDINHLKEILEELKLVNCYIIFADFSNKNWARYISKEILEILR